MKLKFMNPEKVGRLGVVFLSRAFNVAVHEYGLDNIDGTVELEMGKMAISGIDIIVEDDEIVGLKIDGIGGETTSKIGPNNTVKVRLRPSPFEGIGPIMHAWAHEMKHVAQVIFGELVSVDDNEVDGPAKLTWKGTEYTREQLKKIPHDKRPWESDAEEGAKRVNKLMFLDAVKYARTPEGKAELLDASQKQRLEEDKVQGNA